MEPLDHKGSPSALFFFHSQYLSLSLFYFTSLFYIKSHQAHQEIEPSIKAGDQVLELLNTASMFNMTNMFRIINDKSGIFT